MQAMLCIVLLAIGLSQISALPSPALQLDQPGNNLMQFLLQSRDLSRDGSHSIDCISYYLPLIDQAGTVYKEQISACLEQSALEIAQINDTTKADREAIDASATNSCDALNSCSELEAAENFFECYSKAGSDSTKSMFTISANASELLAVVKEEKRLIQVNEYVCTNKTQRIYEEDSAKHYEDLKLCMEGAPIPSETTSSEAPSTQSSTESSSTDSSSTDSSSTESSSTDSSSSESSPDDSSSTESSSTESSSSDSSSDSTESSTESSSTESTTASSGGEKEALPEEDLKSESSQNKSEMQRLVNSLQEWFKTH
nr:lisH domain-containing protein C1711.05 [Drosophila suzukii]